MRNILLLFSILLISSCTKIYKEVYIVEKYPIVWQEDIVIQTEHQHVLDPSDNWTCIYLEPDTICWTHYDTIVINKLKSVERIK